MPQPRAKETPWRPIPGFAGYEASEGGQVRNVLTGRVLGINKFGKSQLWIDGRNKTIRTGRLILLAFKGPSLDPECNFARHLDDDVLNNRLDNLAWGTVADNYADAVRNGTDYSACRRGRKQSAETVAKRVAARAGYRHSPETLAKISQSHSSPEMRARKVAAMRGRFVSLETRAKISAAKRRRDAENAKSIPA